MRIDLHCHSTCSDGSLAAAEVLARAEQGGLELFCLTDHDTCAGSAVAQPAGLPALRGVELSAREAGRTVHILVFDRARDARWAKLEAQLDELMVARVARVSEIAARLGALGVALDVAGVLARAEGGSVGRPHVAAQLVAQGQVRTIGEAFDRYLHDGGPGDVAVGKLTVADALALGRAVGASMALAHPHTIGPLATELVVRHRADGLEGIEAYYGSYAARDRQPWLDLAAAHDLAVTGGSDFHGQVLPHVRGLGVELPAAHAGQLRDFLGV